MAIAKGGKTISGAKVGLLVLESQFPRIPGDGGNATTWPFPVLYKMVPGATPDAVVRGHAQGLVERFVDAAKELVALGADGITTNCGFMALHQQRLADACQVPVATSSLLQVSSVQSLLPQGKRVGILTVSKASLTDEVLTSIGIALDTPIQGTDGGKEFSRVLLDDELELNVDLAREDVVSAAKSLTAANPDVGAIVLECTNMPPYASAVAEATGLPVYDFYSLVSWFHAGLRPQQFQ